jgi:GH43 family beta-xylosidase
MKMSWLKESLKNILLIYGLSIVLISCISCEKSSGDTDTNVPNPPIVTPVEILTFKNPVRNSGPDPWVYKNNQEYFVTYTTGNNITLVRTEKMSDLNKSTPKVVWTPPLTGLNSAEIWAPEIHKINNVWYIYYAASDGNNINHRMWVLENKSENPLQGSWVDKGELKLPDNKWAIDGTVIQHNDKLYFAWSGWEGDVNIRQNIYIIEMESPLKVLNERVCILKPSDSWEINNTSPMVLEGPQFFVKDNKLFLFYSAGGCWKDEYSIGVIWMDASKNPLDINSWTRSDKNPLFVSNNLGNAFGPGHNSFFKSLKGDEDWILYHANPQPGQGCGDNRSIRMQKFLWDNSGFPILGTPEPLNKALTKPSGE